MNPNTKYIILIMFPIVLSIFAIIVFLYLRKWIRIWQLPPRQALRLLRIYKIFAAIYTLPVLIYNIMNLSSYFKVLPLWLKIISVYPNYIWHLTIVPLSLFLLSISIVKLILSPAYFIYNKTRDKSKDKPSLERRHYIKKAALIVPASLFAVNTIGVFKSEYEYTTKNITIKNSNLKGLNIVQISDTHFGSFMGEDRFMFYADKINKLRADFIFVTGDILDFDARLIPIMKRCFGSLNAKGAAYACLGNHDYYTGAPLVQKALEDIGFNVLVNNSVNIRYKDWDFNLMGLDYPYINQEARSKSLDAKSTISCIEKTLKTIKDDNKTKILLSHHPSTFIQIQDYDIDLTLSGHTHGGQFILGKWNNYFLTPIQFAFPYLKGHYTTEKGRHLYVNSGLGHWLPLRLNCPVEITNLRFV